MRRIKPTVLERIPISGASSFTVREFRQPAFRYPWHQHVEVELTWIIRGDGLRYVGESIEPFHAGDLCLLGSNLAHTWLSSEDSRRGVHSIVVQFDPSRWGRDFLRVPEMARVMDLLARSRRGLHFQAPEPSRAVRLRSVLSEESPLRKLTALMELLDGLSREKSRQLCPSEHPRLPPRSDDKRLGRVMSYLAESGGRQTSQAEAARLVGLAPSNFSRFFRRAVGRNFQSYVNDMRLGEVCRQLLETDRTVSEVAFATGFENLSNFNRSFRQSRGMSPTEFRRRSMSRTDTDGTLAG